MSRLIFRENSKSNIGRLSRGWLSLLFLFFYSTAVGEDGLLQELRDEVRPDLHESEKPTGEEEDFDRHKQNCSCRRCRSGNVFEDDDEDSDSLGKVFGEFVFLSLSSPFWGPHAALEDDFEIDGYFQAYPYAETDGYMAVHLPLPDEVFDWSGRFRAEYASDFDDLSRTGGHLLLSTTSRFGLETEWNYWREELPRSRSDQLWTGDMNVVFRFAQSEKAQFRAGLGFNWLADSDDADFGINTTYGADFFPARPWVLSGTIDWGRLGDTSLFHARGTVGAIWRRTEVFTGYEYFDIGSLQIDGLIAGVRIWF